MNHNDKSRGPNKVVTRRVGSCCLLGQSIYFEFYNFTFGCDSHIRLQAIRIAGRSVCPSNYNLKLKNNSAYKAICFF